MDSARVCNVTWRGCMALALLGLSTTLMGITATGTVAVSGAVTANCTISGSTLPLGTYNVLSATALTANANVLSVACTRGAAAVTIALNTGANPTHASGTTRALNGGGSNYLSYELYTSASLATVWSATNTVSYSPTSLAATVLTVYGKIPALQNVVVGAYTDTVTATVSF